MQIVKSGTSACLLSLLLCTGGAASADFPLEVFAGLPGQDRAQIQSGLKEACSRIVSRTLPFQFKITRDMQLQWECPGMDVLGGKRNVRFVFGDDLLDAIHVRGLRDYLPVLQRMLRKEYGEPALETVRLEYYRKAGIALQPPLGQLSFYSERVAGEVSARFSAPASNRPETNLGRAEWKEDLARLDGFIRNHHIRPFWLNNEQGYAAIFYEALSYIEKSPRPDPVMVNAYLEAMVAYLGDGHSYIAEKTQRLAGFPFHLRWFEDELVIVGVSADYARLLGATVDAFDRTSAASAAEGIRRFVPAANASAFKADSVHALRYAGLLYAAGLIASPAVVELTLTLPSGDKEAVSFTARRREDAAETIWLGKSVQPEHTVACRDGALLHCAEYLEDHKAVYVRYGLAYEEKAGDIRRLAGEMRALLEEKPVERLVVDVRGNPGGDSYHNAALVNAIADNPKINDFGKLFVLTDRNTFSAAVNFAGNMETKTRALFVGEPVGDRPIFSGEGGPQATYVLPNSNMVINLSFSEWSSTYDNDSRSAIRVDYPREPSLKEYLEGKDPVLDLALRVEYEQPVMVNLDNDQRQRWVGRFDYSPDKALEISQLENRLVMNITGLTVSRLYPVDAATLLTDMRDMRLKLLENGDIRLIQTGSSDRELARLLPGDLKALELILRGRFTEAGEAYRAIHAVTPDLLSIRGNSLGILASYLAAGGKNSHLYDRLRDIALDLHGYPIDSWEDEAKVHVIYEGI